METPLKQEANFNIYFFPNARIKVQTSFLLSKTAAKIIEEYKKGLFNISLNGIVTNEIEGTGIISIEKMSINSMNISAKKGETVTIKFELRCFSNVDILYSDEKSRTVEIHYGLTNFIFSGCSSPSLILPTPVFCISLWPHPQTGVLFEEWVRSGQSRSPLACYQSHLGPPRSNHKTRSWHLFSFKRN